jgi:cholest-4-en-3-one 26-monooxygenase
MNLADVDLTNPDNFVDGVPHHLFRFLRSEAPVFWHEESEGPGFWAITKHADLTHVSKQPKTFSSWLGGTLMDDMDEDALSRNRLIMLNMDAPEHRKYRNIVNAGFTPRSIRRLEGRIRERTVEILDRVKALGEFDFVAEISAELPLQAIAELLGVPFEDRHKIFDLSNRLIGFDDPEFHTSPDDGQMAAAEMWAYANELALERQKNPGDDLVSKLLTGEVDGHRLTEMEFDSFFLLLAVAGNETTRNLISHGMHALFEHPEELQRLVAEPSLIPSAVEEMLRYSPPVMYFRRTATEDTELRGVAIKRDQKILMYYPSANRDEEVFEEPDRFDVTRDTSSHRAFGIGEHFCLGSHLARLEIRVMFEELLRRFPDIRPVSPPRRLRSNFIDGIKELRVRI